MHETQEAINKLLLQAKKYDEEDSILLAINSYQEAAERFLKINDINGTAFTYTKAIQILKRESEFYKAAMLLRRLGDIYKEKGNNLDAARQFSRSATLFKDVKEFQESSHSYNMAADTFYTLKGEFYSEAGKHYKMATLCLINFYQHEYAEYEKYFNKTLETFKTALETKNISEREYLLYIVNFYTDIQDALERNGIYREESAIYIKKMDAIRAVAKRSKRTMPRYFIMTIWKWTCDYGENTFKWVLWIIADILTFAMLYYFTGVVTNPAGKPLNLAESLFFATNFFATNGFGSFTLTNQLAFLLGGLNIISGIVITAILITIIARKITR